MAAGRGAGRRSAKNADAPHGALQVLSPLVGRQRQRVAMGRAIVRSPQAFLMDEPLSSLDAKLRVQMRTTVSRIQSQLGTTMVYVTHDQTEAMTLGDRVAVMRGGVIQQVDTPKELYRRPANLFVAGFLGSPAMNFLPVHPDDNRLRTPMGDLPLPAEVRAKLQQAGAGRGLTFSVVVDVLSGSAPRSWPISASRAPGPARGSWRSWPPTRAPPTSPPGGRPAGSPPGPASRAREGEKLELWVDPHKAQPFNPQNGAHLTL